LTKYEAELERLSQLPRAERFEQLIAFPAQHLFKVIGRSRCGEDVQRALRALGFGEVVVAERPSAKGKYLSVTFTLEVSDGRALDRVYQALEQLPDVVYLL
jgi:putative lipoic acid-binding regulatory protein